jgi:hypothetical protein
MGRTPHAMHAHVDYSFNSECQALHHAQPKVRARTSCHQINIAIRSDVKETTLQKVCSHLALVVWASLSLLPIEEAAPGRLWPTLLFRFETRAPS